MFTVPYERKEPLVWRIEKRLPPELAFPFIIASSVCYFFLLPLTIPLFVIRAKLLLHTLKKQGRYLSWKEFEKKSERGEGSVIIEVSSKMPPRIWWTSDRILAIAPSPPLAFCELNLIACPVVNQPPFLCWCYENYLAIETGRACYVEYDDLELLPERDEPLYDERMQAKFPNQDVAVVTFYDTRY